MKIGAEEKNKVRVMVACLALALLAVIYWMRSGNPGSASASPPQTAAAAAAAARKNVPQVREITLDPTLRTDLLLASQAKYEGGKRNIFRMEDPPPPPIPTPVTQVVRSTEPPPPPPPPPINLKFYGFSSKPGEPKKIFLAEGEEIFVAKEGDIINRRYKIVQINATSVMVEDMMNNNKQPIPLTTPPPTG
ncbi:MAG: hypothetical protein LAP21_11880 [Acidobacteriia bacterium]|nr:hypothetical protein [Terriglobia bacterium]